MRTDCSAYQVRVAMIIQNCRVSVSNIIVPYTHYNYVFVYEKPFVEQNWNKLAHFDTSALGTQLLTTYNLFCNVLGEQELSKDSPKYSK